MKAFIPSLLNIENIEEFSEVVILILVSSRFPVFSQFASSLFIFFFVLDLVSRELVCCFYGIV